jgi:hypothetical protein
MMDNCAYAITKLEATFEAKWTRLPFSNNPVALDLKEHIQIE